MRDHRGNVEAVPGVLSLTAPAAYRTAQERIAALLRRAILSGELLPGRRLTQNELAELMGTSISPVREAVRQLAAEGLLRVDPNTRMTVPAPSATEARQVHELLAILEPLALRKAAGRMSASRVAFAEDLLRQMDAETEIGNYSFLNWQFHDALTAATGEVHLTNIIASLRSIGAIYVGSRSTAAEWAMSESNAEHRQILDAIIAGDGDRAADLIQRHLGRLMPDQVIDFK